MAQYKISFICNTSSFCPLCHVLYILIHIAKLRQSILSFHNSFESLSTATAAINQPLPSVTRGLVQGSDRNTKDRVITKMTQMITTTTPHFLQFSLDFMFVVALSISLERISCVSTSKDSQIQNSHIYLTHISMRYAIEIKLFTSSQSHSMMVRSTPRLSWASV